MVDVFQTPPSSMSQLPSSFRFRLAIRPAWKANASSLSSKASDRFFSPFSVYSTMYMRVSPFMCFTIIMPRFPEPGPSFRVNKKPKTT